MGLKRKRSSDSSSISTSSSLPLAPNSHSPTPFVAVNLLAMDTEISSKTPFNFNVEWPARKSAWEAADLGCRTRKRWRDNRPDERVIHENTLQKLFAAQRTRHPSPEPVLPPAQVTLSTTTAPVQKSTLHSFWNISAPPVQPSYPQRQHAQLAPPSWDAPRCAECDASLLQTGRVDSMDVDMMDLAGSTEDGALAQFSCNECDKLVCGMCAVEGERRCCLQCATTGRRGGRGWGF